MRFTVKFTVGVLSSLCKSATMYAYVVGKPPHHASRTCVRPAGRLMFGALHAVC